MKKSAEVKQDEARVIKELKGLAKYIREKIKGWESGDAKAFKDGGPYDLIDEIHDILNECTEE